jgi:phosphate transport system substrate-binding protein
MKAFKTSLLIISSSILLAACDNANIKKYTDTPTSGTVNIAVDESFYPFMDSEVSTFESIYDKTKLNTHYLPEADAFAELLKDSVRIVVSARDLTSEEREVFKKLNIVPRTNNENPDTTINYPNIEKVFNGTYSSWKQLNPASKLDDIRIVFDNSKSSTARYIKERFNAAKKTMPANCFAVKTNKEMIEYVNKNKNAIGILGVNWISDDDDTTSQGFLHKIKVMSVAPPDTANGAGHFYKPYQAYIAEGLYPLRRSLYIVSREAREGLGNGFAAFVAGDKGQRIILKSAIVPATVPVRIIGL